MKKSSTLKLTLVGLFAAIIFVTTYISFPMPNGQGYLNFGDGFIMMAATFLGSIAIPAAAIGSMLTDIALGFALYSPATFIIKGLVALISWLFVETAQGKKGEFFITITGFILAEIVMVGGYLIYESFLYGFVPALASIPLNCLQGAFGIVLGSIGYPLVKKLKNKFIK